MPLTYAGIIVLTQCDIARYTGLSVGGVNLQKGNGRSLRYILTPQGLAEKTAPTGKSSKPVRRWQR